MLIGNINIKIIVILEIVIIEYRQIFKSKTIYKIEFTNVHKYTILEAYI